jgi:Carboxypeptidase regulatory-like domain
MSGPPRPADVAEDGSFTFQQLAPERYQVSTSWGPVYIKSMRLGDTEMQGSFLDVRNGTGGAALTVVVSSLVGQISGTVTNSDGPVAGATIALVPADLELSARFATSRRDGTYTLGGLAPGSYKIAVVETDEQSAISRGKGFQDSAETAEAVEIQPGDKITKDFKK